MKNKVGYFKSDCIKNKSVESGRTMLEMLGVLGIMGIIMYGAVAGINYGMSTYKINQTYNEVQEAIQGIQDMYSWSRFYPSNFSMETLMENDIFPKESNPFAGTREVEGVVDCQNGDCFSFKITYVIGDPDSQARLLEMDWGDIFAHEDGQAIIFCPRRGSEQVSCDD